MKKMFLVAIAICTVITHTTYGAKEKGKKTTTTQSSTTTKQPINQSTATKASRTTTPQSTNRVDTKAATTSSTTTEACNITISFKNNTTLSSGSSLKVRNKDNAVIGETNSTNTALVVNNITKNTPHKITIEAETGTIASTLPFTPTTCGQQFNVGISDFAAYFTDKPTSALKITFLNPKKLSGGQVTFKIQQGNQPEQIIGYLNINQNTTSKSYTFPALSTTSNYKLIAQDESGRGSFQTFQGSNSVNFNLFVGEFGEQRFYTLYK